MKLAACFSGNPSEDLRIVERMARAQALYPNQTVETISLPDGALATVSAAECHSAVPMRLDGPTGNILLVSGVPVRPTGDLHKVLASAVEANAAQAGRILANLDGAFGAMFWDDASRRLVVVTDLLGAQPLYLFQKNGLVLFASELKAIAASERVPVEMDSVGWGAMISYSHLLNNRTLLNDVRQVDSATILTYTPAVDTLESHVYWHWPAPIRATRPSDVDMDALMDAFNRSLEAYRSHGQVGTVLLSGGFDSRLVLAALKRAEIHADALIVDHPNEWWNADGRFAVQVAESFNVHYEQVTPRRDFYSTPEFVDYLIATDASTPALYLYIANVFAALRPDMRAVWEGFVPGAALKGVRQRTGEVQACIDRLCPPWDSPIWCAAVQVFGQARAYHLHETFTETLATEATRFSDPDIGVYQFVFSNFYRNRIAPNPAKAFSNIVLPFLPGMNREFWDLAAAIPHRVKVDLGLYKELYKRYYPAAGTLPFCSDGFLHCSTRLNWRYLLSRVEPRLARIPRFRSMLRRLGLRFDWEESRLIAHVLAQTDPNHPDLDGAGVTRLKREYNPRDPVNGHARRLIFHWHVWRWIMEGRLTTARKELLFPKHTP